MIRSAKTLCLAFVLTIGMTFTPSTTTRAFSIGNPFKAAERALGSVARGVGNIFGQGLAGLASPTINAFADDVNRVLAETLVKADNILEKRINQVDSILTNQLNSLDSKLSDKIQKFDQIMDQKIGAVDIVATKAVQNAEDSLISVLRFGAVLILVASLIFVVARYFIARVTKTPGIFDSTRLVPASAAIGLATIAAIVASFILTPPAGARIAKLQTDFKNAALTAYRHGELNDAAVYAKQLTVVDPTSVTFGAFQKIAEIQRDILYRPTTLKSNAGANELLPRIRRLEQLSVDPTISDSSDSFSIFISEQAAATSSVVLWQLAQTRSQQQESLCSAASALTAFAQKATVDVPTVQTQATPFTWLAYSYLRWGEILARGNGAKPKCESGAEFSAILTGLQSILEKFDEATPPDSIQHVVTFNKEATKYFAKAAPLYTTLIMHDAAYQSRAEPAKAQHKDQRDKLAERLIGLWTEFSTKIKNDVSVANTDISLAAIGIPASIAIRAQLIRNIPDPNNRAYVQGTCAQVITDVKNKGADLKTKYENLKPSGEPAAAAQQDVMYRLASMYQSDQMKNMLCSEQVPLDNSFYSAEKSIAAAVKKSISEEMTDRNLIAKSDLYAGLVACIPKTASSPNWTGHEICGVGDFQQAILQTKPFAEWLSDVPELNFDGPRYAMVR